MKDRDLEQSDYVFDAAGRMTAVQLAAGRTAYLSYDQAGLLSRKVLPNHEVVSYHRYDVAARLEQLEHWRDNSGLELVTYFHYERNPNGAITRIRHEAGENSYFSYDALERLTAERRVATSFDRMNLAYDYDAASNRTLKIERIQNVNAYFTYDGRNLLTREWSTSPFFNSTVYFAHDGAQRMTSARSAELQSNYFTFDQRDRVTRVEFADAFAPDEAREFGHTGVGERVRLAIGGEETYLTYDGSKLLTERDSSGLLRRYRHNQSGADARGSLIEVSDVVDSVERTMYPAFDQRGSLVRLEEAGSADASAYAYSSFGEAVPIEPSQIESEQRLGFVSPVLLRLETANEETMLTSGDVYLPRPGSATSNVSVYGPNVSGGVLRQQGPSGPDFDPCGPRPLTPPVGLDPAGQWVRVDYPDCWKWLPADTSRSWGCPPPPAPPAGKTWILLSPWPSCAWSLVDDNPRGEKCPCYVDLHFVEVTQPTLRALSGLFIDAPNDAILVHSQLEVQRSERHTAGTTVCPRYVLELTDFIPEPDTPDHPDLQKRHGQIKSGYAGAPDSPIAHLSRRAVGKTYGIFRWRGGHVRGPRLYRDRIAEDNCGLVDCLLEAIEDVPTLNYGQIVDYGRVPDRWTSNSIPAFLLARCGVDVYTVLEEFQRAHYRAFPIGWIAGATLGSERG